MKKTNKKTKYTLLFTLIFLISFISINHFVLADDNEEKEEMTEEEKEELKEVEKKIEKEKEKIEEKKEEIEGELEKVEAQKSNLQQNLNVVQQSLVSAQQSIKETEGEIESREQEIERHNKELELLNQKKELYQRALASTLRRLNYQQNEATFISIFNSENESKFLGLADDYDVLKDDVLDLVNEINNTKEITQNKKREVQGVVEEKKDLHLLQQKQEQTLASEKNQTQSEISSKQATISELNTKLAEVESDLSSLLGESVEAGDIGEAAEFASKKTGVRKSFILGMLVKETNLGRYTGGCTYKKSRMGDTNSKIFKRICKDLGYDYKKKKVSCPLSYGIGGAMGVAQFMPTTWVHYESRIEKYTGHSPADPWSLTDGVMAMAEYLKDSGASSKSGEFDAARRYYCGSNISRSVCVNYANDVMYWAKNYKDRL